MITVVIAAVIIFLTFAYMVASTALWAENTMHTMAQVCGLVKEYMDENEGAWPRSWEDLEKLPPREGRWEVYPWPEGSKKVQKHVEIDFNVDIDEIETESFDLFYEKFDVIWPRGAYFDYKRCAEVGYLYDAIRKYQRMKKIRPVRDGE